MTTFPNAWAARPWLSLCALLALVAPGQAQAQESAQAEVDGGVYLEAAGGSSRTLDQDISFDTPLGSLGGDVDYKAGFQYGGALGYRINQVRFELASQFRRQEIDSYTFPGIPGAAAGDMDVVTGLLNFYYDFDLGWPVRPYVGAGIGFAILKMDGEVRPNVFIADDDTNEIAWNATLGLSMAVAPSTELFFAYRRVQLFDEATVDASFAGLEGDLEMDWSTNEFGLGLRYTF